MNDNELHDMLIAAVNAEFAFTGSPRLVDCVLAAIREHHAIVRLPEPDEGRDDWCKGTVLTSSGLVYIDVELGQMERYTPSEARAVAAALLAAADAAERG